MPFYLQLFSIAEDLVNPSACQMFILLNPLLFQHLRLIFFHVFSPLTPRQICQGDEANRKLAGHDIKNQRLIQTIGTARVIRKLLLLLLTPRGASNLVYGQSLRGC